MSGTMMMEVAHETQHFSREEEEEFLSALGDESSRRMLLLLDRVPGTVQSLVAALHLPQSTVYHKLHELQKAGLVAVQSVVINPEGKRVMYYRSLIEDVQVEIAFGKLDVRIRCRDLAVERSAPL